MERRGTLKSWNDDKGFGFIRPEQGGADVFAHISAMRGERRPSAGDQVLYIAGSDAQGRPKAEHIRLDAPMTLDRPAIRRKPSAVARHPAAPAKPELQKASRRRNITPGISSPVGKLLLFAALMALPIWGSTQFLKAHSLLPALAYLSASLVTFFLYWSDKASAIRGRWRTQESTLHLGELLGGWPGALLAQQVFRHKTRKASYQLVFWGIVMLHQLFWLDELLLGGRLITLSRLLL